MRNAVLVGAVTLLGGSALGAAPPSDAEVAQVVGELRDKLNAQQSVLDSQQSQIAAQAAELRELRKQVPSDWLTEQRAIEIRSIVSDVLADADTRASLLQGGATAGHDGKNFFVGSADGSFLLKVGGQIQPRYIANVRDETDDPAAASIDENEFGFQVRRAKFYFEGNIFSPKLTFKMQTAASRDTGSVELEENWINYALNDQMKVFVGRFVDPVARDSFTSNARQLTVERSITSYVFVGNDNYSEGGGLDWRGDAWRIRATVTDGIGSGTPGGAGNDFMNDATDFAATARVDWKVAGNWKQMDDYSAWADEPFAAFVGGAIHYEVAETGDNQASGTSPAFGPYDDLIVYTIDGSIEVGGFNVFAALIGQQISTTDLNPIGDLDNFGAVIQAGYMIVPDKFEPFARYELLDVDQAEEVNVITAGFNYYWHGHSMKFSADVVYCLDPLTPANTLGTSLTGAGLLPDNADADEQIALRAQFQLLF